MSWFRSNGWGWTAGLKFCAWVVPPPAAALVFLGEKGGMLGRGNFGRSTKWPKIVVEAGLPVGFRFHDLRHTGNQLAANSGATPGNSCTGWATGRCGRH